MIDVCGGIVWGFGFGEFCIDGCVWYGGYFFVGSMLCFMG